MVIIKQALVLCGGGSKGSYLVGAYKAIKELEINIDIVTGTSIGALNGCLIAQKDDERLFELWDRITMKDVLAQEIPQQYDIETIFKNKDKIESFLRSYVKEKGADIEPFKSLIKDYFNNDRLQNSNIDFGCIATIYPTLKPVYINKEMLDENGEAYLLASASCFPIFPIQKIDGKSYIDGGYFDNLPIDYAFQLGATNIIAIDLSDEPNHFNYVDAANVKYVFPKLDLGSMLNFDREVLDRNRLLGYYDVYKAVGKYSGIKYTFEKYVDEKFENELYALIQNIDIHIVHSSLRTSKSTIMETLRNDLHKRIISYDDVIFGLMDSLLDIAEYDIKNIYKYDEVAKDVVESYHLAFEQEYELIPKKVTDIISYIKDLDRHSMIEKLINMQLFENKRIVSLNTLLTLLPFEVALANYVILLKEKYYG